MSHIFISHVEEDADIALEIALGLEEAGYTTWYYELDSIPGPSYLIQTGQAIEQSDVVVLVISPHSLGSHQVTREVVRAYEGAKRFIPVLRGITHTEFQNRQPEWREAVGAATSIYLRQEGVTGILTRIIDGVKTLGIHPASKPNATRIGRIHSTLDELQARGIPAPVPIAPAVRRPPAEVRAPAVRRARAVWFWLGFLIFALALGILTALLIVSAASGWEDSRPEVFISAYISGAFLGILLVRLSRRSIRHGWFWPGAVMFVCGAAASPASLNVLHDHLGPLGEWVGLAIGIGFFSVLFVSVAAFCLWRGWPRTGVKRPRGEVSAFLIPVYIILLGVMVGSMVDWIGETGERDILSFSDDFEDGVADGWHLGPGWRVEIVDGNYVLSGLGGPGGQDFPGAWPDVTEALNYAVEADFMFLSGALPFRALEFNVRQSSAGRYVVWILPNRVDLGKGTEDAIPVLLYTAYVDIGLNEWHTVDIALDGGNIKVYINGNLEINYWDENPIAQGSFDLHSHPNSSVYVDNILVGTDVPAGVLTGNRGILSFSDDFEDGVADGWHLDPGWRVELADGNYVLRCEGNAWETARPDVTRAGNYAVEADFMLLSGHFSPFVRAYGDNYYSVLMKNHEATLRKRVAGNFVELAHADVDIGSDRWHSLEIALDGGSIKVYIDDELEIDYWDDEPLPEGNFFFGSDSDACVDNISVRPYP
jgi:MFS family permease